MSMELARGENVSAHDWEWIFLFECKVKRGRDGYGRFVDITIHSCVKHEAIRIHWLSPPQDEEQVSYQ
jgi:hypothetical protein